jgi:hypothetical protein
MVLDYSAKTVTVAGTVIGFGNSTQGSIVADYDITIGFRNSNV